ncbi:MAG: chromosome segregation protein SMC, partial [Xanthomonadales bacterium]|nr:chromosome segregation protein SMC [Xanthomonadales bacterium]
RQVSRDGVSLYYLNGTRCRRKDVRDLFLGTGLGSRSYSIIEQGMISEVVEAKPEEIRGHLEEAAGISKYKERRRETERRIQHTRDNLDRLSDLREEVGKHLNRLKRQASAANRYRKLKQEKRELESRLLTLRWKTLMAQAADGQQDLTRRETKLQESIAGQRAAEAALEELHEAQGAAGEAFNEVQGELYAVGSEIARLEQTIQHARELQERQKAEFQETESALQDLEKHMVLDKAQVEELTHALADVEPSLTEARSAEDAAINELTEAEDAVAEWQKAFEAHHLESTESNRDADRVRADIEVLDQRILQASRRIEALDRESGTLDAGAIEKELGSLEKESDALQKQEAQEQERLDTLREALNSAGESLRENEERNRALQRELHTREGSLDSLRAMQEAALDDGSGLEWLEAQGLSSAPRLAEIVDVETGWEAAVEVVLGAWLQSVVVKAGSDHGQALGTLENAALDLVEDSTGKVNAKKGSLAEKVRAPDAVMNWMNGVTIVKSLGAAWEQRSGLDEGQSLITPEGEWVGAGWVRVARGEAGRDSMLARAKAIEALEAEVGQRSAEAEKLAQAVGKWQAEMDTLAAQVQEQQAAVTALHRRRSEVDGRLESRRSGLKLVTERQTALDEEGKQLRQGLEDDERTVREARGRLEQRVGRMAGLKEARDGLESQRSELMSRRETARKALGSARDRRHDLALKAESRRASLDSLRQSLERMDTQLSQLQQRYLNLSEQMARADQPEERHRAEMDGLLARRVETEGRLGEARARLQGLENEYREKDAERQRAIRASDEIREDLERARLR